jgi:Uma2 family endonuclease
MSIATPAPATPATLDDLMKVDGKAELIGGRIVRFMPSGYAPSRAAFNIAFSLETFVRQSGHGVVFADGMGFALRPPLANGRQSFCPDAAYYSGPLPKNKMRFVEGTPDFAIEVRSETHYTRTAEKEMAEKRTDYFASGTKVVWDVDPAARQVRAFRSDAPQQPIIYSAAQIADAEPAISGWKIAVDEIFG